MHKKEKFALLLLRLGLGLHILIFGIFKLISPSDGFITIGHFITSASSVTFIGFLQIVLGAAVVTGWKKRWSYGICCAIHAIAIGQMILFLQPKEYMITILLPYFTASIALYLLRKKDTLWSLDN